MSSMKKINKNPNWNHNSSQYYNSWAVSVKMEREEIEDQYRGIDLLWKNSEWFPEEDEIHALGTVLFKLCSYPRLGENIKDKIK